jgi:hypothetical protein
LLKTTNTIFIIALVLVFAKLTLAQEAIWPDGYNITADYEPSANQLTVHDTLTIIRTIVNNEDFDLENLYLVDNLPVTFFLTASMLGIDSSSVDYFHSGPIISQVVFGYDTYRWAIDLPAGDTTFDRQLHPGETLVLEYSLICQEPGDYVLPFHTICCSGNSTGIFSTADSISVTVLPFNDIDDNSDFIPKQTMISRAYPNPFNASVNFSLERSPGSNALVTLSIYNLLGQLVYFRRMVLNDHEIINWHPSARLPTGNYYYVISSADFSVGGKIILLK